MAWSIVSGDVHTGTVRASGTTAVTNGGLVGYRVASTATTGTTRAVYRLDADIPDITLAAGSYWLTWALAGTGAFAALSDGGSLLPVELPFSIHGVSAVPEAGTNGLMLLGLLGLLALVGTGRIERRRSH